MALLDCFCSYHQIGLQKEDEEKASFITRFDTYCYIRMPEGLKNVGSTFCRMMKDTLMDQICRNVFTYINDIVVVIKKKSTQIADQAETITNMHGAQLKLNLENVYLVDKEERC
jgi:hypothetical protein